MKKLTFLFLSLLLFLNVALAQDENTIQNALTMPSDEEIRAAIDKFNFSPKEKEQLFKETKKRLEEMFSQGTLDPSKILPSSLESGSEIQIPEN